MLQAAQSSLALDSPLELALSFGSFGKAKEHFYNLFSTGAESYAKIPCLNQTSFTEIPLLRGKLVRFRGMLQDTSFSSELYPLRWKSSKSAPDSEIQTCYLTDRLYPSQYTEKAHVVQYGDRFLHHIVSIPGSFLSSAKSYPSTHVCCPKFPIPSGPHQALMVKFYESTEYKVCQVVEVIGILEENGSNNNENFVDPSVDYAEGMPWQIHALWSTNASFCSPSLFTVSNANIITAKQQCIELFQSFFQDDALAAEYFLLQCLMCSENNLSESNHSSPFDAIPLIFSGFFLSPSSLSDLLSRLYPTVYLPLSLDILNKERFAPHFDVENEALGLISGRMQIAPSSILLIDETILTEGQLNEQGVENLRTLMEVLSVQQLTCHLPYSVIQLPLKCIPVLFCQKKSVLPHTNMYFEVKNIATNSNLTPELSSWIEKTDFTWLSYYLHWAQQQQCFVTAELSKMVEEAFVQDRKQDKNISAVDLHLELILSRRLGQSLGETHLSAQTWKKVREMEKNRKSRLQI